MKEVVVTANYKMFRVFYAVLGICGLFILGGHAYNYFFGEMMERWFQSFIIGFVFAIGGGVYALGLFKPRITEICISDEGIRSGNSVWDSTFKWETLRNVELHKNKIEVLYAKTGLKNEIVVPYFIRLSSKNLQILNRGLTGFCGKYDVGFSSNLKS
jgi:hypothetical protein